MTAFLAITLRSEFLNVAGGADDGFRTSTLADSTGSDLVAMRPVNLEVAGGVLLVALADMAGSCLSALALGDEDVPLLSTPTSEVTGVGLLDLGLDLMRVCCCLLPLGAGGGINVDLLLSALVSEAGIDLFFPSAGVTYGAVLGGEVSELPRDRVGHASPFCCASLPTR